MPGPGSPPSRGRRGSPDRPAKARPVTPAYLERAALHYLDRYPSSAANLRSVLARKARGRQDPEAEPDPDLPAAIGAVVEKVVRSGLVDDRSLAAAKVASLARRGSSVRAMRTRLKQKGLPDEVAAAAIAAEEPDDLALARRHAERKRLGPFRIPPDPSRRNRDLAALCRAGFPVRIALTVLDGEAGEAGPGCA